MLAALARSAALAGVCLALVGCSGGSGGSSATPGPSPTPDARTLADEAAARLAQVKTFHFVLTHENGGSPIALGLSMTRAEGDMEKPDRLKAEIQATAPNFGNVRINTEVISIGSSAEIQNPFDRTKWVTLPGSNPIAQLFDPAQGATAVLKSVQSPTITGEEQIAGIPCWKLQGNIDAGQLEAFTPTAQAGYQVKGYAWIGTNDHLVYRVRLEGPVGPDDAKNIVRQVDLSNFDAPVTIQQQ